MTERLCLVHYHEIGLKGKNRSTFENQLVTNLHRALKAFPIANIQRISGYIVVESEDRMATPEMAHAIAKVPGVARVSLTRASTTPPPFVRFARLGISPPSRCTRAAARPRIRCTAST